MKFKIKVDDTYHWKIIKWPKRTSLNAGAITRLETIEKKNPPFNVGAGKYLAELQVIFTCFSWCKGKKEADCYECYDEGLCGATELIHLLKRVWF